MDADLELALELADLADTLSVRRYRAHDLHVATKPDRTPVTETDHAVEDALRARVGAARPDDGFLGEETGATPPATGGGRRWIVDPIDGTANYLRGIPVWATLLALEVDGALRVGVVSAPALGHRWWACRGEGARADGDPIGVSEVRELGDAHLVFSSTTHFEEASLGEELLALARRVWRSRGFGDFWQHMLVAEGAAEIAVDPVDLAFWDLAAVQVIVEEAGGRFTTLDGVARADGGSGVSTNGLLHDAVLDHFGRRA